MSLRGGKKIEIVKRAKNKRLAAKCLKISHKSIYYKSKKKEEDLKVKEAIEEVFKTHPSYGHRRIAKHLNMNKKKVLRIMREYNLKPPRLWYQKKHVTCAKKSNSYEYKNLIKEEKIIERPNEVWSSDLTYIKYRGKFYYFVIIQDIVTREIVGYNLSERHDSKLITRTIREAIDRVGGRPRIFHCDRGREYLSKESIEVLKENEIKLSVADKGSPWQNSWSESFFSRFKAEMGDFNRFDTLGELIEEVYYYIYYYNNLRIHSRLNMPPTKFKQKLMKNNLSHVDSCSQKWGT